MSKSLNRIGSLRKHVPPIIDVDEEDDNRRRDSSGRKRVDVVECLLDSSSDEIDNESIDVEKPSNILWLTFNEICHIRYVLAQISLSLDKQSLEIRNGRLCFRCRKKINELFLLSLLFRLINREICYICQQIICKNCSYSNFVPPASKLLIPVRIQNLIKMSSTTIENENEKSNKTNLQTRIICYDCLQLFNERVLASQHLIKPIVTPFRRTFSLPRMSAKFSSKTRYTCQRRRPVQITNCKTEKTTVTTTTTSLIIDL